jgi:hypothetical protein
LISENEVRKIPETTTAQDMLKIWNEETGSRTPMTPHTARYLNACFKQCFQKSLDAWRSYVRKIKSSAYIMSSNFKFKMNKLIWAVRFRVINEILHGKFKFGCREEPKDRTPQIEESINETEETERCKEFRRRVLQKHGAPMYYSWLRNTKLEERGNEILISASAFIRTQAERLFWKEMEYAKNN